MASISRRVLLTSSAASAAALTASSQQQQSDATPRLNVIHIGVDTWGANYVGAYGNPGIRTPHVDKLIAQSVSFADAYPESLPTLPARRVLYTGRRCFPSQKYVQPDDGVKIRGWHPLFAEDVTVSEVLRAAGYRTGFVSDLYHQFKPNKNFHRGFDSWRWIRGQEQDRIESGPVARIDLSRYTHPSQAAQFGKRGGPFQYLLNRYDWKTEDDYFAAKVFREASQWLDRNANDGQPFYLHVESFNPHEYWDPPEDYYRLYMKSAYKGPRLIHPPLNTKNMSAVEVEHVRALYAGLVTFTDAQIGKLLTKVKAMGLMANTIVVFVGDHGTLMGEQGQLHKGETRLRNQVTRVPLAIYHPGAAAWAGRRVQGFVQHTDLAPTLLDLLGVDAPKRMNGESLRKFADSGENTNRPKNYLGWGEHGSVRCYEWSYIGRWSPGEPAFDELYHLTDDPKELTNVAAKFPEVVAEYRGFMMKHIAENRDQTTGTFALPA